jgi:hypothetical protein
MRPALVGAPAVAVVLGGVLVADLALVVARSGDDRPRPTASATPTATPTPTPTRAPGTRVPFEDLESRLLAPPGYEQVDDAESRLGTLDAAAFAARFTTDAKEADRVRTGLVSLGFETARGHLWVGGGRVYSAVVARMADGGGAARLLATSRAGATGRFTSRTVPGALTYVEEVDGFSVQHGLLVRGRFVYEVTLTTPEPERDHAVFDRLLQVQRDHAEQSDP